MIKMLLMGVFACLLSLPAHATFEICNKSATHSMGLVWASQYGAIIKSEFSIGGWFHFAPGSCQILSYGDVANNSIWIHAVSNNIIMTIGGRPQGSRLWDSDQQFCISDDVVSVAGRGNGITENCAADQYLAPFPVYTWFDDYTADYLLEMNPDDFVANAILNDADLTGAARLPDMYGAVSISTAGKYYANRYSNTAGEARQDSLDYCRSQETEGECTVSSEFKNQCYAAAYGNETELAVIGAAEWTEQQTLDSVLMQCSEAAGVPCQKIISVCSTQESRLTQLKLEADEAKQNVVNWMIDAIGPLFQSQ